mgnify:CR=1 FL=1
MIQNICGRAVNEFMNLKTLSIREIEYKLFSKGLKRDIISNYIEENYEVLNEYERDCARKIFIKKQKNMDIEDIILFLKKKGYKEENISYGMEGMN